MTCYDRVVPDAAVAVHFRKQYTENCAALRPNPDIPSEKAHTGISPRGAAENAAHGGVS